MKFFARLSSENGCLRRRPNFQAGLEHSGAVRSVRTMRKTANLERAEQEARRKEREARRKEAELLLKDPAAGSSQTQT